MLYCWIRLSVVIRGDFDDARQAYFLFIMNVYIIVVVLHYRNKLDVLTRADVDDTRQTYFLSAFDVRIIVVMTHCWIRLNV